ncbi:NAD kinase-like [Schistocerca gregaria]|uniref:NAD kinase-like n=1 Tax=Schistocerca gregaria TaxID=7010 RepID=UPI00211F2DE2|nr:NAD kinase-like [Schistocerca gregaria]
MAQMGGSRVTGERQVCRPPCLSMSMDRVEAGVVDLSEESASFLAGEAWGAGSSVDGGEASGELAGPEAADESRQQSDELAASRQQSDELAVSRRQSDELTASRRQSDELTASRQQSDELTASRQQSDESAASRQQLYEMSDSIDSSKVFVSVEQLKWVASADNKEAPIPRAGIRLLKGYDHIMVDEHLTDRQIQVGPTTIKLIRLVWESQPQNVIIIKKRNEPEITELLREMATWLKQEKNINVMVEVDVLQEIPYLESFDESDIQHLAQKIDLVICLGGDGTVLHVNYLFQTAIPPVMAFNLGSLGFLTPYRTKNYKRAISSVLKECYLTLRSRLFCIVSRQKDEGEIVERHTVLNEVVIERGNSPYLSNLECYCDGHRVTTIQADGIIISTTTGSTAYSLAAGGSMVHPQVPAIIFTPICPHSLSFRPLLFPDSVEIKVQLPNDSRSSAWASFDGRCRTELERGDYIIIRISKWPFVWVNKSDTVGDWFKSLAECLHWNTRQKQKPIY